MKLLIDKYSSYNEQISFINTFDGEYRNGVIL